MRGRAFEVAVAVAAALLSWLYIEHILRGGPRIIDATAYWLEARTMSEGMLTFPVDEPHHSTLGRFLLRAPDGESAAVIFPPGYPAILAIAFAATVPMALGPVLAAALVLVSADFARQVARRASWNETTLARGTAVLSATCAVLRYHTADTMSHGLAALCFTGALAAALRVLPRSDAAVPAPGSRPMSPALVAGVACGWLFATRPVSAVALALALLALRRLSRAPSRPQLLAFALGCMPGVVLWLAYQHATTGSALGSTQLAYYALSDGPPGCFRYGFGDHIGCLGEHGNFVRRNIGEHYGAYAAAATTMRRLKMHLSDALNAAPLFSIVLVGAWLTRHQRTARWMMLTAMLLVLAYAPFYFDGNYNGGGARMLNEAIVIEHVLAVVALSAMARTQLRTLVAAVVAPITGFALFGFADHQQLQKPEGGHPMFSPGSLAGISEDALVLVHTDHAFNLARAPTSRRIARYKGDALDRLSWESLGRPTAYHHRYTWTDSPSSHQVQLTPLRFDPAPTDQLALTIEGESLWPPTAQSGGWVWPAYTGYAAASRGRWLELTPTRQLATARIELPAHWLAGREMVVRGCRLRQGTTVVFSIHSDGEVHATRTLPQQSDAICVDLQPVMLPTATGQLGVAIRSDGAAALDRLVFGEKR